MRRILFALLVLGGIALLSGCEVPTELSVNSTVDAVDAAPGDGVCETATEDECTLRAAVQEANTLGTPVSVQLTAGESYVLSGTGDDDSASTGDLDVTGRLTIDGNGASLHGIRPFDNRGVLNLTDVTISQTQGTGEGIAIRNQGALTLTDTTVTDTFAFGTDASAVHQLGGSLVLRRTTFAENHTDAGAALHVAGGFAVVADSALVANIDIGSPAALRQTGGNLIVIDSTIGGQATTRDIVICRPVGCATIPWPFEGEGILQTGGELLLFRTTVTDNTEGVVASGTTRVTGSVIANNVVHDCVSPLGSLGYNLDEDGTCLAAPTTGDRPSSPSGLPTLQPGQQFVIPPARTNLLQRIPVGTAYLCDGQRPVDQRGLPRPAGPACDIGAVERQVTDP